MNEHEATEIAYRNGYEAGVKEFAERLEDESTEYLVYEGYGVSKLRHVVEYAEINQVAKELTERKGNKKR